MLLEEKNRLRQVQLKKDKSDSSIYKIFNPEWKELYNLDYVSQVEIILTVNTFKLK